MSTVAESPWRIEGKDFPYAGAWEEKVRFCCNYGILAPSVHNVQPWEFVFRGRTLTVSPSRQRKLQHGDPTGRQTWLSLGACVENIILAANHFGLAAKIEVLNQGRIFLAFSKGKPIGHDLFHEIPNRRTNRHNFEPRKPKGNVLGALAGTAGSAAARVVTDPILIGEIAQMTRSALGMAFANPSFRRELSELITPGLSSKRVGIPGHSLAIGRLRAGLLEPHIVRFGLNSKQQADKDAQLIESAAALVLVFSKGDLPKYWVDAGRLYQHKALAASAAGLSQSTTAAVVEAADFHSEIEKKLGLRQRLQAVLRVGLSDVRPRHSARLSVKEVTVSN